MLSPKVLKHIGLTVKNYGRPFDNTVIEIWELDLEPYTDDQIIDALACYRQSRLNDRAPTVGQIIGLIRNLDDDGRPTPDEAWGIVKPILGDEQLSAILTEDMTEAWGLAGGVWPDEVGSRRTFIASYTRSIENARKGGFNAKWWLVMGSDKSHRAEMAKRGLEDGRLSAEQVKSVLPSATGDNLQNVDLIRENIDRTDLGLTALPGVEPLVYKRDRVLREIAAIKATLAEKQAKPRTQPVSLSRGVFNTAVSFPLIFGLSQAKKFWSDIAEAQEHGKAEDVTAIIEQFSMQALGTIIELRKSVGREGHE